MLKGKDLILATKSFAKEDRRKSWVLFISTLILTLAAFSVTTFAEWWIVRLPASILLALLLVRLFAMYHDFLHRAILKNSTIAKVIFTFFGYFTLNPSSIWKRSHDYHHKHNSKLFTSSIGSFPVITLDEYQQATPFQRWNYLFIRHPLTIFCGYIFAFLYGMCLLSLMRNPKKHWDSGIAILFHAAVGSFFFVYGGWETLLFSFIIPTFLSSFLGAYLFYAQHNFPGVQYSSKEQWSYAEAAIKSTSYMRMNKVMHWFTGNIGYHHVHHLNALIPFYRLPEVHTQFEEFNAVKRTSLSPKEMYRCFQQKVWNPAQNQMLTMQDLKAYS